MVEVLLENINNVNTILFKEPFVDQIKEYIFLSFDKNTPFLDKYIFSLISKRAKTLFEDKPFSLNALRKDLIVLYGINIDNSKRVDCTSLKEIKDIYLSLKFEELEFYLDFLEKKITKEGQKLLIDKILKVKVSKDIFNNIKKVAQKLKIQPENLVKEIKYLVMKEAILKSNALISKIA